MTKAIFLRTIKTHLRAMNKAVEDKEILEELFSGSRRELGVQFLTRPGERWRLSLKRVIEFPEDYPVPPPRKRERKMTNRLDHMDKRRFTGEFFTPLPFAKLALEYVEKELGPNWYNEYKIWDPAAGTGNLEYYIPNYNNVYMSTLEESDVEHLTSNNLFPGATIFQYDYLNDDVDLVMNGADLLDDTLNWKLPRKLREDLADKNNKWLILMNPPYGTSQAGISSGTNKKSVNKTHIREYMLREDLGLCVRELSRQFMYRVVKELPTSHLGLFATQKYINSPANEVFRKKVFCSGFGNGFIFPASSFQGTKGRWPVSFILWDIGSCVSLDKQNIILDVFDFTTTKIGRKSVHALSKDTLLNKWVDRTKKDNMLCPPLNGPLNRFSGRIFKDALARGAIACMCCPGGDVQHQTTTFLLSSAYGAAGSYSVIPNNFEKSLVVHTIRRIVHPTWLNNKDQFKQPNGELPEEFTNDCVVWSLFNIGNQTSSLRGVEYKGEIYQVRNQFFPFCPQEIRTWETTNIELSAQLRNAHRTFVCEWLDSKDLSPEAAAVLAAAKKIYKLYYKENNNLDRKKWKLDYWDVGWYQIRNSLKHKELGEDLFKDLKEKYDLLTLKLRPKVYEYGFLDAEVVYG